jgi:hypothetical protein
MSTAANLFPRLLGCFGPQTDASLWNFEVNLATDSDVNKVLTLFHEAAYSRAERRSSDLLNIAESLAADIASLADAGNVPRRSLMLFRLNAASVAIEWAINRKHFTILRDWILYAIKGQFVEAHVLYLNDMSDPKETVLESPVATAHFVRAPFLIWAWGLFYYARVTGDLKPIAASYLAFVEQVCEVRFDELSITALVYAGTWATEDGDSRGALILRRLGAVLEKVPLPRSVFILLSTALSAGVGQKAGIETVQIAETALTKFKDNLVAFDKLQLLSHACAGDFERIAKHLQDFEDAIQAYSLSVDLQFRDQLGSAFEKERLFDIIAPIVCTLATGGRVADAFQLVCLWRNGRKPHDLPKIAFLLPTWHKGVAFAVAQRMELANVGKMSDSILRLTNTGNAFFGTNVVVRDDNRFRGHASPRPGIPDTSTEASVNYEKAISQHYEFDRIREPLEDLDPVGMLIVPQSRDPIQPMMLKALGRTLPILASCAPLEADRPIRRACIWWASTTYGDFEQRWVIEVLQRRHIEVVLPSTKSKDEFNDHYSSQFFDLFWMIGHGRFDHYYPEKMSVDLSETDELTLSDWMHFDLPLGPGRRLFVANLCDSGTTAILGGTGELGLPVVLAHSAQALVAHLWPVSSMHATIFGAVLAIQIVKEQSYFNAYCEAVKIMISGREGIEAVLVSEFGASHEIIERLRGAPDTWGNLFVWGSPTFMS